MNGATNPFRRSLLTVAAFATAIGALAFTFTINDTQPPPNGTGLPVKWPAGTIRIRLMLGDTANLNDGTSFNQSARTAAETWNTLMGSAQFQAELATGSAGDGNDRNELSFASTIYGRNFDEDTLAVTTGTQIGNQRIEADIIFNTAYTWDSYRGNARRSGTTLTPDIRRVALHELGHVLGLDHPDENGQTVDAIMNSSIGNRDSLSADDTEGVQSLYGPPGAPPNDNFANATTISMSGAQSVMVKGYNTNATKEVGEPIHANDGGGAEAPNPGGRSVWWNWTAPSTGRVTIDTRGSYFDTLLGVHTGNTLLTLTRVAGSDDIDPGVVQASRVVFVAEAGTTYRLAVDGFNNADAAGADNAGITLNLAFEGSLGIPPAITTQPANVTVNAGSSATFSVTATGSNPLTFQWSRNGTPIGVATMATYSIPNVTTAQAGTYSVTVANAAGSVTSNSVTLTVNNPAPTPPPPSSGGGGGGGGAPSLWFLAVLAALGLGRLLDRRR
jgi:hypothetical protein